MLQTTLRNVPVRIGEGEDMTMLQRKQRQRLFATTSLAKKKEGSAGWGREGGKEARPTDCRGTAVVYHEETLQPIRAEGV